MNTVKTFLLLFLAVLGLAGHVAHAQSSCKNQSVRPQAVAQSLAFAEKTMADLNASGHKVVLLARKGQDLRNYDLQYSHVGWAYQAADGQGGLSWRVVHKLFDCSTDEAVVYQQGLAQFFAPGMWRLEGAWLAPTAQVQENLLRFLQDPRKLRAMHNKPYSKDAYAAYEQKEKALELNRRAFSSSMLNNPETDTEQEQWRLWTELDKQHQHFNLWALEALAAAMDPKVESREQAHSWLQANGYTRLMPLIEFKKLIEKTLAATNNTAGGKNYERLFSLHQESQTNRTLFLTEIRYTDRISFSDKISANHPVRAQPWFYMGKQTWSNKMEKVTVDSIFNWLQHTPMTLPGTMVHPL